MDKGVVLASVEPNNFNVFLFNVNTVSICIGYLFQEIRFLFAERYFFKAGAMALGFLSFLRILIGWFLFWKQLVLSTSISGSGVK